MEILTNPIATGIIGVIAPAAIIYLWNLFLPREKAYAFGYKLMSVIIAFSFEKIGEKHGRKIAERLCNTLTDFTRGMHDATLGRYQPVQHA